MYQTDHHLQKIKLVLVEDEKLLGYTIRRFARANGMQLIGEFTHPDQLTDVSETFADALFIIDLGMDRRGMQLIGFLRQHVSRPRIIAISGCTSDIDNAILNKIGIPFLAKPFSLRDLEDAIISQFPPT